MTKSLKNILTGIASIVPHTEVPRLEASRYRATTDAEALYNDWYKIGQDMQKASTAYFSQNNVA